MTQELWTAVDEYIATTVVPSDAALSAALEASAGAGLPSIQVSVAQGRLLEILARITGGWRVLEIGTLAGYSTICLARGLRSGGKIITIEIDATHAEVAAANFVSAGLADRIELRIGSALDVLPRLEAEGGGPFDLVFIDADKASIPEYFSSALRMSRPGTLILVDNVVREGRVIDAGSEDASVKGVRKLNEMLSVERRVVATVIQTVGAKGYDGLAVIFVSK